MKFISSNGTEFNVEVYHTYSLSIGLRVENVSHSKLPNWNSTSFSRQTIEQLRKYMPHELKDCPADLLDFCNRILDNTILL